ncbi:hypothetical protein [Mesobacillus subterraneus]|uniref:Uncharacterized protein n=1 Tax=Mesobacillus subterraneus TaxID=285983 RepID=A0A427TY73_9BACI|nr:hypothetical protein [Mesobacillus subterraneus]RSD29095.1 hypothetical protein EJA10_03020 [Mesobacillus subterraneus]
MADKRKTDPLKAESIFKEEIKIHEAKQVEKKRSLKESGRWQTSNQFVIIALTTASILDIVIVLI